jgi:hypothetical protein
MRSVQVRSIQVLCHFVAPNEGGAVRQRRPSLGSGQLNSLMHIGSQTG